MSTATEFPPATEEAMETLLVLATGTEMLLHADSGRMAVRDEDGQFYEVPGDALDDLMARKWVVPHDDVKVVETTETGQYWLRKWLAKKGPKKQPQRPRRSWRGRKC